MEQTESRSKEIRVIFLFSYFNRTNARRNKRIQKGQFLQNDTYDTKRRAEMTPRKLRREKAKLEKKIMKFKQKKIDQEEKKSKMVVE